MTDHTDLIARLEAATGPSRELDRAIARALGYVPSVLDGDEVWFYPPGKPVYRNGIKQSTLAPTWTESIDAAMTLVPKGWFWRLSYQDHPNIAHPCVAELWPPDSRAGILDGGVGWSAETVSYALCIAALRARSTP